MANILLVEDSDVAGRAMQGILARGNHRSSVALQPAQAWRMLRAGLVYDLVILEVKQSDGSGVSLLQRMRDDWFWRALPVIVYTSQTDADQIRRVLRLGVQNYLIKPYNAEVIHTEVAKAIQNPWRSLQFEEVKAACATLGLTPEGLEQKRRDVMAGFERAARIYPQWAQNRQLDEVFAQTAELVAAAEGAGIRAGVNLLQALRDQALNGTWHAFETCGEPLEFASRLIFSHLNPSHVPEGLGTETPGLPARDASERSRWESVNVDANGCGLDASTLMKQIDALPGCPVVGSAAAAFQMLADGRGGGMSEMMDLVAADPGLSAQVLTAANRLSRDESNEVEDLAGATILLGEMKLTALAHALPTIDERHFDLPPLTWTNYWMFQVAVGRVSQFVCKYLEFECFSSNAVTAGLLHDVGKLLLVKVQPQAFQAIVRYARERRLSIADAERKYLGCTTRDLAVHFATTRRLPVVLTNVIRWLETPALATQHVDLISIVAVARHLCLHASIGCSGETLVHGSGGLATTPAWAMLQPRLFPSFDVRKFELQAHAFCLTLRNELSGQRGDRRPAHAQRSAELV